jgi:starch synthase
MMMMMLLFLRFGFFCGAALEYLKVRNVQPNILHCHDWQSAPVAWGERPNNAKCVFTIHNLNYGADLVGRAMGGCEVATTVSPTYAREVGGAGAAQAVLRAICDCHLPHQQQVISVNTSSKF